MSCSTSSTPRRTPADAGYLESELAILGWMGKPVLVLLNQTGPPREEADDVARWRAALEARAHVRGVIAFDAFARCWVQEFTLFDEVAGVLSADLAPAFSRLVAAWRARRFAQYEESMAALAHVVGNAACARIVVPRTAMLRKLGTALGLSEDPGRNESAQAAAVLTRNVTADMRAAMEALIAIHGLTGRAAAEVEARIERDLAREGPVDEGKAAAMGGVLSGAAAGLAADLAAGGLTFGAGMLTGALLGALGGAGLARAFNVARGQTDETIRWDDAFLERLTTLVLVRYLAVAHYGRGRGSYVDSEAPAVLAKRHRGRGGGAARPANGCVGAARAGLRCGARDGRAHPAPARNDACRARRPLSRGPGLTRVIRAPGPRLDPAAAIDRPRGSASPPSAPPRSRPRGCAARSPCA